MENESNKIEETKFPDSIKCPKCKYPQFCGCKACIDKCPEGYKTEIPKGESCTCGNCGHTLSYDQWMDIEWKMIRKREMEEK